jgi:hypothetical protein
MKITFEIKVDTCTSVILNKGRVIGEYSNVAEFWSALRTLDRLQAQLERPEAFCDCQDIYTKGKR